MLWAALCITANSGGQCPLWVISGHDVTNRDVRFTPKSGHENQPALSFGKLVRRCLSQSTILLPISARRASRTQNRRAETTAAVVCAINRASQPTLPQQLLRGRVASKMKSLQCCHDRCHRLHSWINI